MSLCVYNSLQTLVDDNLQDHLCDVHICENGKSVMSTIYCHYMLQMISAMQSTLCLLI